MKNIILIILLLFSVISKAQNIISAEYFWDTDPGNGLATALAVSGGNGADSVNFSPSISIGNLKTGLHYLYIRTKDNTGKWSLSEARPVSVTSKITQAEYFWDTDPGAGLGTSLTVTGAPSDTVNFNAAISAAGLNQGIHYLYIRTKDNSGAWSLSEPRSVFVNATQLLAAEYFWDTDPGIGLGISLPVSGGNSLDSINFSQNISAANLTVGIHYLYLRTKDQSGRWSLAEVRSIDVKSQIIQAEYFWDTDPGIGLGVSLTTGPISDTININRSIPTTGLAHGVHYLYLRTKDNAGKWSLSEPQPTHVGEKVNMKFYISGYYLGGGMMNASIDQNLYPTIADSIVIHLASGIFPYNILFTSNALLNTNGNLTAYFDSVNVAIPYYIIIRHRTALETWSSTPFTFNLTTTFYDFSSPITKAYGSNMISLLDGNFGLISGDLNQDGLIESADYSEMENAVYYVLIGYSSSDLNGDGIVESADYSIMENSVYFSYEILRP